MEFLWTYPSFINEIDDVLSNIGISLFGILIAIGIVILMIYTLKSFDKFQDKRMTDWDLLILCASFLVLWGGAALFDHLYHYIETGSFQGGITYASGFICGIITFIVLEKVILHIDFKGSLKKLNIMMPFIALAQFFGRLGCFTAGCCFGKPTDSIFGVVFPANTDAGVMYPNTPIHPTQLYEAVLCLLLFIFLFIGSKKISYIKKHTLSFYLMIYGTFRLILELFFRGDDRGLLLGVSPSTIVTIIMIIGGAVLLFVPKMKEEVKTLENAQK